MVSVALVSAFVPMSITVLPMFAMLTMVSMVSLRMSSMMLTVTVLLVFL